MNVEARTGSPPLNWTDSGREFLRCREPGVERVVSHRGDVVIELRGAGDCFHFGGMVAAVMEALQAESAEALNRLVRRVDLARSTTAFEALPNVAKTHATTFAGHMKALRVSALSGLQCRISLSANFVANFMVPYTADTGDLATGVTDREHGYTALYKGCVVVARLLAGMHPIPNMPADFNRSAMTVGESTVGDPAFLQAGYCVGVPIAVRRE